MPFFIILTPKSPAWYSVMFIFSALVRFTIKMNAVTVIIKGDQIGPAKFLVNEPIFHILFGERKGKFAADSLANRRPAQTINPPFVFEGVLVTDTIIARCRFLRISSPTA